MNIILHRAADRGRADFGWLKANYSFSFASWYNPEKMRFGHLRVLNDDFIEPGGGFDTHPHDNMEIITIPLEGSLAHRDSTGGTAIISEGEVQIMSAGSGIEHSEFNASQTDPLNLLQIWIFPEVRDIIPRYDQKKFNTAERRNRFQLLVSPEKNDNTLWIHQNAYISIAEIDNGADLKYSLSDSNNGVYLFLISGSVIVNRETLNTRDAIGIENTDWFNIRAVDNSTVLSIEVSMR
jgi:redox-sensitive bicupin YhaK (pirin superfamily)